MTKRATKQNGDGTVKPGIRVPPEIAVEFDEVRGRDSQAEAGLDAIVLWLALDRDTRSILAGRHPLEEKRKYAAQLAARIMQVEAARIVDAAEARAAMQRKKPRRSR
jgi:hypothetical protein